MVYCLQQSLVTFRFLIHQPYLSLAFSLPSLSGPGPKPVTELGWAGLDRALAPGQRVQDWTHLSGAANL